MYTTLRNLALVRNLDTSNMTCACCNCGRPIEVDAAYADDIGRIWCGDCLDGRIVSIYEFAIHELTRLLDRLDIPYEDPTELWDGQQIRFTWCDGDVICHSYSYGGDVGLLETMGFAMDGEDVTGRLTTLQALEIILHEWNEHNKAMRQEG